MNPAYDEVISANDADRGALFAETAARLGTGTAASEEISAHRAKSDSA